MRDNQNGCGDTRRDNHVTSYVDVYIDEHGDDYVNDCGDYFDMAPWEWL